MAATGTSDFLTTETESITNQRLDARMMLDVRKVVEWCLANHVTASYDLCTAWNVSMQVGSGERIILSVAGVEPERYKA